jgi:N-acyl homoserine lactone hydrolase
MALTIEPLHCGTLSCGRSQFEDGASDDEITIPVPSWLIRHPEGLLLVDCGMHPDLAGPSKYNDLVSRIFRLGLSPDKLIGSALRNVEVDPDDIDMVILTHLHFDHAGGLGQLPNARIVIQEDEWLAGSDDELARSSGFVPSDYRLGHDIQTVKGEHDLFGDGLVTCIPTPGHTPGHQSVRVRLADREVVLCGDCAYFEETLDGGALPPRGYDRDQHAESIKLLQAIRKSGATLIPGHDPNTLANLPTVIA